MKKLTKTIQDKKLKRYSFAEDVAEEIESYVGLQAKAEQGVVSVDTIAGPMEFKPDVEHFYMHEVYRFIHYYGLKLANYGHKEKLKLSKE